MKKEALDTFKKGHNGATYEEFEKNITKESLLTLEYSKYCFWETLRTAVP